MSAALPHVHPVLYSADVDASTDFLLSLGLLERWRAGDDTGARHAHLRG